MYRSPERNQFLADLLTTAIEHYGYGFPEVIEYHIPDGKPSEYYAVITDRYVEEDDKEYGKQYRIDVGTMATGLRILRERRAMKSDLALADRTNGDDGDYDVIDALAVLECALYGDVIYN